MIRFNVFSQSRIISINRFFNDDKYYCIDQLIYKNFWDKICYHYPSFCLRSGF